MISLLTSLGNRVDAQYNNDDEHFFHTIINSRDDCNFYIYPGQAGINYMPHLEEGDSIAMEENDWDKEDFYQFLGEFDSNCRFDQDSIQYEINALYAKNATLKVDIKELYRNNDTYEKSIVFHSKDNFGIIHYRKNKTNK